MSKACGQWGLLLALLIVGAADWWSSGASGTAEAQRASGNGSDETAAVADSTGTGAAIGPARVRFPEQVPGDCDNLLYVADPLPHLERLLSCDSLRAVLAEGRLARAMPPGGPPLDPRLLLRMIRGNSGYIPTESVVALPSSSLDDLTNLAKVGLLVGLCNGAIEAGEGQIDRDLPKLHEELLATLNELELPQVTLWAKFRDPGAAAELMALLRLTVAQAARHDGVEMTSRPDLIGLKTRVGKLMPASQITVVMVLLGIGTDPADPKLAQLGESLAAVKLEAWLEQRADGLRLSIGPRSTPGEKYPLEELGQLWQPERSMLAFGRWNTGTLLQGLREVLNTWKQWEKTPTGQATRRIDTEDMLGDLRMVVRQLEKASPAGTMRLTVGDSVEVVVHSRGLAPAPALRESDLMAWVPKDAEVVMLDTTRSMADHISDKISDVEHRLATKSLQYELSGRTSQAEMAEQMTEFYYGRLSEFRRLVHQQSLSVFEPPVAVLLSSQGRIKQLTVEFEQPPGERNRVVLRDAPVIEYAVIGRLQRPDRRFDFPARVWKAFLAGVLDKPPKQPVHPVDLALGVTTHGFDGQVLRSAPGKPKVTVDGDLLPHYFVEDGWLVFSTSARLSRLILDARRGGPQQRFQLPADDRGRLVAYGRVPAATMANYLDFVGQLLADFLRKGGTFSVEGPAFQHAVPPDMDRIGDVVGGIGDVMRLVDQFQWRTVDREGVRQTHFQITLAER